MNHSIWIRPGITENSIQMVSAQRKWAHDRHGNLSLLATYSGWKTFNRKSSKWWASPVVIQHNFHGLYLSQGKEKLLLKVVYVLPLLYPDWIKHEKKIYGGITKRMNFNCPCRWNQWKHWAKWQQLEAKMQSFTYFLRSSSLKCSKQTFTVHSAIVNWVELLSFVSFSLRGEQGN